MTIKINGSGEVGDVFVSTTNFRGHSPEELAERAVAKIISVGESSHPLVREQAVAFQKSVHEVVLFYLREAARAERVTIEGQLRMEGLDEIANLIASMNPQRRN